MKISGSNKKIITRWIIKIIYIYKKWIIVTIII